MSVIFTLTSCAVIAALSLTNTALSALILTGGEENETAKEEGLETQFADHELLLKTLNGFDCHMELIGENEIRVATTAGSLIYRRAAAGEAFRLYLDEITDAETLIANIRAFEVDYGRNVQAYTYDHIRKNLSENMSIAEETIAEDDSIYLTINVE